MSAPHRPSSPGAARRGRRVCGPALRRVLLAGVTVGLGLAGCGGAQVTTSAPAADARRCTLLATNDSEAHFDGARVQLDPVRYLGTIARVAAYKQRLAAQRPDGVLLISAGDVLQGRYMERSDRDRARAAREAWQVYDRAGYDLGTLGNHEFDAGPAVLRGAILGLQRYRLVVSNLAADSPTLDNRDGKLWDVTVLRSCGGIKIGFFGLLTPSTRSISQFGDTRFADAEDPVLPAARRAVAALQAAGAEVIVGITHLGIDDDVKLARDLRGVDVLIGGHSHTLVRHWRRVGDTFVVQAGERFSHLGQLELYASPGQGMDRQASSWRVTPVDDQLPADASVESTVQELRAAYPAEAVIGTRKVAWELRGRGRHAYGQRVARALWRYAAAHNAAGKPIDVGVVNSGGLRTAATYPPGPVTNLEVRAIHPFGNRLVVAELDGEALRDVLEHACGGSRKGALGERIELWGLRFRCDASRPAVRYTFTDGRPSAIASRGERVFDAQVGGAALEPGRRYRVAVIDYLARGGSGFVAFGRGDLRCLDGTAFADGGCKGTPTDAEIIEAAVRDGSYDEPLPE